MMNQAILSMLKAYACQTTTDYENALKEIIQEVALLGLWRGGFFNQASFYGGTALRILYGLPRFSEDLDFTLNTKDENFKLLPYFSHVRDELTSYGFQVSVEQKPKVVETAIESAFIKANTLEHLIKVDVGEAFRRDVPVGQKLRVKFEVDVDPPGPFQTEIKNLIQPIPFPVVTLRLPYLFAGKLHAILQRAWGGRTKGRDFYDFIWYLQNRVPANLSHLEDRLRQTKGWTLPYALNRDELLAMLRDRFARVDFAAAKRDMQPFIKDSAEVALWSPEFFTGLLDRLHTE